MIINFLSRRGPAYTITDYMKLPKDQLEPIMTNSENIVGFGPNAYSKPATGLNILRETIMGREFLIMHLKNMQDAGHLNIQRLLISSAQWKMQVVKILIGSGEDGSMALMPVIFLLIQ